MICHTYVVLKLIGGTMSEYSYFCGTDLAKSHFSLQLKTQMVW
ncbi:hypothetical protein VCRA2127O344_20778 [Vibrio crassostreae]|nr:hypothetical protein VCRA2127O344_20778 [Vibrio crassostreae]